MTKLSEMSQEERAKAAKLFEVSAKGAQEIVRLVHDDPKQAERRLSQMWQAVDDFIEELVHKTDAPSPSDTTAVSGLVLREYFRHGGDWLAMSKCLTAHAIALKMPDVQVIKVPAIRE